MSEKAKESLEAEVDSFWLETIYPDVAATLAFSQASVGNIKEKCIVVVDANVLLLPYRLGAQSFSEIRRVYEKLAGENRLFLPGQAAREFLKNRASKLRDILRDIANQASSIQIVGEKKIGFLEEDDDYKQIIELSEAVKEAKSKILKSVAELSGRLKGDVGSDPVSKAYQKIFADRVADIAHDSDARTALKAEMNWRYGHSIPPGFKDRNKPDEGIGDLLIWKTVLSLGEQHKQPCIFVTEDSKGDWWVQSEGTFQPRIELIEEYRRASEGQTIHLLPLSALLETFDAPTSVVDDTKTAEIERRELRRRFQERAAEIQAAQEEPPARTSAELGLGSELVELTRRRALISNRAREVLRDKSRLENRLRNPDMVASMTSEEVRDGYQVAKKLDEEYRFLNVERRRLDQLIDSYLE